MQSKRFYRFISYRLLVFIYNSHHCDKTGLNSLRSIKDTYTSMVTNGIHPLYKPLEDSIEDVFELVAMLTGSK